MSLHFIEKKPYCGFCDFHEKENKHHALWLHPLCCSLMLEFKLTHFFRCFHALHSLSIRLSISHALIPTLQPTAEEVVITRLWIGHTKATKSHILSRGPPTACHHCGQTLTIAHMLLECAVLQECCDEYYTVDSLNALFETIPETCIVEFLREAGFFYLIWCNLSTSTSPETWTIWSDLSNLFREWKQLWDTFTCVGRLICPEGRVSSLNKSNPSQTILHGSC